MAFWGVEVKPGKPFTHKYEYSKGRLHISMVMLLRNATLGLGTSTAKSTLQCNVGKRSPVYLCSLYPGNTESLQLNLELEEVDQVVLSVIGPRSIHLCGYYLATARNTNVFFFLFSFTTMERESYGEDIADTETERSDYNEEDDEYDDSFIDDDEKASHDNRPKGRKGSLRRLRKKYQLVESDDDGCYEQKIIANDSIHDQTKEIENEDNLPILSLCKNKASGRVLDQEMDASVDRGAGDASNKNGGKSIAETNLKADYVIVDSQTHREAEPPHQLVDPCAVLDVGDIKNSKKKKKRKEKETKSSCNDHSIKLDNGIGGEPKMEKMTQDFVAGNKQQQHADDKETETMDKILPSSQVDQGQGEKPKKKRKERSEGVLSVATDNNLVNLSQSNEHNKQHTQISRDVNISDNVALPSAETDPKKSRTKRKKKEQVNKSNNGYHEDIIQEDKANRNAEESQNLIHNFFEEKEQHQKLTNDKSVDNDAHDIPDGNQPEDRKVKRRKKMSKSRGNGEVVNSDVPVSVEQSGETEMMEEDRNKREDAKPSQVRTFSNGLLIQELEKGIKEGKIAASGKKISIYYTGKLKENGVVVESNAGQAPFKFRLGKGEVIKGWDVGLEGGMQVGEKRRLVIPPSMTSESDGHSAKIPPNSWLVYDFELVKVH
ncbi:Peptidyl-prolyl cis-trans isomerase FKBP43, partial [Mucuna pruriens]